MNEILQVCELKYSYMDGGNQRVIFEKASLTFCLNTFYAILGDSGSGKTTFLSIIAGQDDRYGGRIYYREKDIKSIGLDRYRRSAVSMVYQSYNLIPQLSALENILVAMDISENVKKINKDNVYTLLSDLGISHKKANRKSSSLSGGEQQRVAIARAVAVDSEIIIADEPTGNLDREASSFIVTLFQTLAHKYQKCVIMVTHNERLADRADMVYRIAERQISLLRQNEL